MEAAPSKPATSLRATKSLYAQLPAREGARRTSAGTVSPPKPAWFRLVCEFSEVPLKTSRYLLAKKLMYLMCRRDVA
jgi:hypothetical protein